MTAAALTVAQDSRTRTPAFGQFGAMALVFGGIGLFALLLWAIGAGEFGNPKGMGGGHAASPSLEGYGALADLLEARGNTVTLGREQSDLRSNGLVILTPPHDADGDVVAELLEQRAWRGPTILVLPKWLSQPAPDKEGWTILMDSFDPQWAGALAPVGPVSLATCGGSCAPSRRFEGLGLTGALPAEGPVRTLAGPELIPVVRAPGTGALAALVDNGGTDADGLRRLGLDPASAQPYSGGRYPLLVVAEPDLLNNRGLADMPSARAAVRLIEAVGGANRPIVMDVTLNGLGRGENLLTLAFRPPFLAATLCLLLAALLLAWRAFLRFGPPESEGRAIAIGKAQLVANAASLVERSGRLYLLGRPYAEVARRRIVAGLSLPTTDRRNDDAIAAALDRRGLDGASYIAARTTLSTTRAPDRLTAAGRRLHALAKELS